MRLFRCDRCKKEFTGNDYTVMTDRLGLTEAQFTSKCVDFSFDLCDDCRKDFENWFRQPMVDKAFEEAHAKAHAHEDGSVTVLGLPDGRLICPVCGHVFTTFTKHVINLADGRTVEDITTFSSCPKCGSLFNHGHITYTDDYTQKGGDDDDTTRAEN